MWLLLIFRLFVLALLPVTCTAHGSSMSTDGMTNSSMMTTYLHFTPLADTLFFAGWVPETPGAIAGASIGLFLLALLERFVAACRPMMEIYWRAAADLQNKRDGPAVKRRRLRAPAFVPAHDIARGAMHAVQATLGFAIMLAVMTFQAAFIISLVIGLGVGEMLFGRYAGAFVVGH